MAENTKSTASVKAETANPESVKPGNATIPNGLKSEATVKAEVTEAVKSDEPKKLTAEERKAIYDALPMDSFRETIDKVNKEIAEHNANIASIQSAEQKDPKLIKAEIFEQNPKKNAKLAKLREQELKLEEQIAQIRKEAYAIIDTDGLMPKELTPEAVDKLKAESAETLKSLRNQVAALESFEEMMPAMLKGKLLPLVDEIHTRRGTAKTGGASTSASGSGAKRPRFKRIEINDAIATGDNTVYSLVDGKEKYNFMTASAYLRKQHKGFNISASDLTKAYYEGMDAANMPEEHTFEVTYTFKDTAGHDQTIVYKVKAFKA